MTIARFFRTATSFGLPRHAIGLLLGLQLAATLFEGIGIGMLLPVFQLLQAEGGVAELAEGSRLWTYLVTGFDWIGLQVTAGTLMAVVFFCVVMRQAFTYVQRMYQARVKLNMQRHARDECFGRTLRVELAYVEGESLGTLVNDYTLELERALAAIGALLQLAGTAILLALYVALMLAISVIMTLAALVVLATAVFSLRGLMRRTRRTGERCLEANRQMSAFLVERLRAIRLIRLSGTELPESRNMSELNANQRTRYLLHEELHVRLATLIEPIAVGVLLLFLYVGVVRFGWAVEELGLFLLIILRLLPVVKEMAALRQSVIGNLPSLDVIESRLQAMAAAAESSAGGRTLERLTQGIDLRKVRFRYHGTAEAAAALDEVTLRFAAQQTTALVGPSGGGKSTLIDLLPRLRVPDSGEILFDGVPAEMFDLASLRRAIAYAPQAPQIFDGTMAAHIGYGRADADMDDIRAAAKLAGADEFIEALPDGYDTQVGESGLRLSGGQRQRLDLARALVKRAPILILDEPTSNLDAASEELFRRSLRRIRDETDITIIIIGHRLSTVRHADCIVVLRDGRVLDSGSHEDLLARPGWYEEAYAKQHGSGARQQARLQAG